MPFRSFLIAAACALGWSATPASAQADKAVVVTPQVRAELVAHAPEGVEPGKPLWLGLSLTHKPDWHTYWKNSGDSGLPTSLEWQLPAGLAAGDIAWPVPRKIPIGSLANYGYEGTVLLPVPLTVTPDFKAPALASQIEVKLRAAWLVCRKECIPEEGEFTLKLPLRGSTALHTAAFEGAFAAQPRPLGAGSTVDIAGDAIEVKLAGLPAALHGKTLEFFPETPEVIETAGAWTQAWAGDVWTARVPLSSQRSQSPQPMPVVVALDDAGQRLAWRAEARVTSDWPRGATPVAVSPQLQAALDANAATTAAPADAGLQIGWIAALVGALLGGLILNFMPCVFPVLAIKMLGFARHAEARTGTPQAAARALRVDGLAYSAGVVLSFVALGGLLLALRAAGEQLGWGFQLQSPGVVAALAVLFTLMGLNLAGLFEFGQFLPGRVASLESRRPAANAFLSGVLAVAIASPCTAPFMGASMGFAVALPAGEALLVFAAVGLGMALPFLAASLAPALARLLPRPGPWMDVFRRLMAFPMFATVAWLVWVLGQQSGIDGAAALLMLLVALAAVAWALGLSGRTRVVMGTATALLAALMLAWLGPAVLRPVEAATTARAGERWQAWAPGRVEQILAQGQPVMVDFTAAWCVTCQYNKKTTLANDQVLADLDARKVQLLRADWTRRDPAITAALKQLGRSGVPVYVLYKPGAAPVVLSEILGVGELRSAIARL
ncbi:protein-disulfide reductase DsbD [Pseudorhodoferax sp. Leaf267]|uniref:protein-disulfide reductase DsbD family protein n=1 Tax=Pseudorhodoferax sp. Leaf267 TaxID=1736316 RepID=UPI0006F9A7BA|nr:thioredoxin family protein [Pseudorhodoferax sp. Leaf267]KQP21696.1 protein-disulfide reductase [Pseudorhodoferax sp. Leaf267]